MEKETKINRLNELIEGFKKLEYNDNIQLDYLKERSKMILKNILPERNYDDKIDNYPFCTICYGDDDNFNNQQNREAWNNDQAKIIGLLKIVLEDIELN